MDVRSFCWCEALPIAGGGGAMYGGVYAAPFKNGNNSLFQSKDGPEGSEGQAERVLSFRDLKLS
jgi:hypothetical protein